MKKYLIRSLKYFLYTVALIALFLFILAKMGMIEASIDKMFVRGERSVWTILAILFGFSLVYPRIGYSKRMIYASSELSKSRAVIDKVMEARDYKLESEGGEKLCYIKRGPFQRAAKLWEDRVSFTPIPGGLEIEGISKDIVRIKSSIESLIQQD